MPNLVFNGTARELRDGDMTIGTDPRATWRVADADLRPRHFVVSVHRGGAVVRPCDADCVVTVGGVQVPVKGWQLSDGDTVAAGSGHFHFWVAEPQNRPELTAAERAASAYAHLVDDAAGAAYPLSLVSTGIGRDHSNLVVIPEPTVSRFHADVRREAAGYTLRSTGGLGTRLNGRVLDAPRLLAEGDQIRVERRAFRFTRQPLPPNMRLVQESDNMDDPRSRFATIRMDAIDSSGSGKRAGRRTAVLAALAAASVAGALWALRS